VGRFVRNWEEGGVVVQHVRKTIEDLRRYIATSNVREDLEEVDGLLAIALVELRRKLSDSPKRGPETAEKRY